MWGCREIDSSKQRASKKSSNDLGAPSIFAKTEKIKISYHIALLLWLSRILDVFFLCVHFHIFGKDRCRYIKAQAYVKDVGKYYKMKKEKEHPWQKNKCPKTLILSRVF